MKSHSFPFVLLFIVGSLFYQCAKDVGVNKDSGSALTYYEGGSMDIVFSVVKDNSGGFIYAGYTKTEDAIKAMLLKVDANGKKQWYKTFGKYYLNVFRQAIFTSDGNILAIGVTNNNTTGFSGYLVKINPEGEIIWENSLYANSYDFSAFSGLEITGNKFLITGYSQPLGPSFPTLVTIDANGKAIQTRIFSTSDFSTYPPFYASKKYYNCFSNAIAIASDGSVILGGIMNPSNLAIETTRFITYLMRLNPNGTAVRNLFPYYDYVRGDSYANIMKQIVMILPPVKIIKQPDGFLVATYIELKGSAMRIQLIKTDSMGNLATPKWHKEYSGLGNAVLHDFQDNGDGTFMLIGASATGSLSNYPQGFNGLKTMVMKIDKDGNEISTSYHGSEINANMAKSVQPLSNGTYAVAGVTVLNEFGYHKMFRMIIDDSGK